MVHTQDLSGRAAPNQITIVGQKQTVQSRARCMTAKCLMSISTLRTALVMSSRRVQDRRAQTNRCSNAKLQLCILLPPGLPSCWIATGDDSSGSCSCQQTSHVGFRNCTPHGLHQVKIFGICCHVKTKTKPLLRHQQHVLYPKPQQQPQSASNLRLVIQGS